MLLGFFKVVINILYIALFMNNHAISAHSRLTPERLDNEDDNNAQKSTIIIITLTMHPQHCV
jgi:hypothetical protein